MKSPKSNHKDISIISTNLCKMHKQSFSMICLHTGCHSCYKLLCSKCKKQNHYQHPNRVISLKDFYDMLHANKMDFIENSLGLCLVNIKTKLLYVSSFRIFILQKQSMLMQNARIIHNQVHKILQQKSQLKQLLDSIDDETQHKNTDKLIVSLQQMKKHISYNPIQNVIRINSQKVGNLKVELQKYCQNTKNVINDIRQYIVKIVQVMIEQQYQEDDIEYIEHEDVDQKIFNINVRKANHVQLNQKQTRYTVQELEDMFGSLLNIEVEKHQEHIENDVIKLEEEIKIKQQIVKNIRRRSVSKAAKYSISDQIKQTTTPPGKHTSSQQNSEIDQHNNSTQIQKDFSKISLNSPKLRDGRVAPKNIGKNNMASPKSPKVRSITDKVNTTPKLISNTPKQSGFNAFNKRTPKNNVKAGNQISRSQVKQKTQQQKYQKNHTEDYQNNEDQLQISHYQKIQQSQEEQLLNTVTNFNNSVKKTILQPKQQSLLLQQDSPQKIDLKKFKQLSQKVEKLQKENQQLNFQLEGKINEINILENKFKNDKKQLEDKLQKLQKDLKQTIQKNKIDFIKQTKQKSAVQNSTHNKDRKTPQKADQKLVKKDPKSIQNSSNNKKLLDQKKQFQTKIQKQQKQIKELKQKQVASKKQHQNNAQNIKQLATLKKKNQELSKKTDDLLKKNQQIQKKGQQMNKKYEESVKKIQDLNKKLIQQKTTHQEQTKTRLNDLSKEVEKKMKSLQDKVKDLQLKNKKIVVQNEQAQSLLQKQKLIISQLQSNSSLQNHLKQLQVQKQSLQLSLKQSQNIVTEMQRTVHEMQDILKQKDSVIQQKELSIKKSVIKINDIEKMRDKFETQVKQKDMLIETNISLIEQKQSQIQKLIKQSVDLRNQNAILRQQMKNSNKIIQQNRIRIQELELQLKQKEFMIQKSEQSLIELQQKQKQVQSELKNVVTKQMSVSQKMGKTIKQLQTKIRQQQALLMQKQGIINEKQLELIQKVKNIEQVQNKYKRLQVKYNQRQKSIQQIQQLAQQKLGQKIWYKDQQIQRLQKLNKSLQLEINKVKQQLSHLQKLNKQKSQSIIKNPKINQTNHTNNILQSHNQQSYHKLKQQNQQLTSKLLKLQQHLLKIKNQQNKHNQDHQKIQSSMLQQYQFLKTKYQQEKYKNQSIQSFDIKNYIPIIKHKQLQQYYQITLKKNQQMKSQISTLKQQKKNIQQTYQSKIKQINQENITLLQKIKIPYELTNNTQNNIQKGNANHRQSTIASSSQQKTQNSSQMTVKYTQIRGIIQQITGDMHLLQQKVKENTVIQKVYLKQLDRKRTQNRKLRQQIQEYRTRERKLGGVRTDRYFQKASSSKGKNQKQQYKVYYATGFAGSESRLSGGGSSIIQGNNTFNTQDNFISANECKSAMSNNSNKV